MSNNTTIADDGVEFDDVIVGTIYIVLSLICIIPYCACLKAMRSPDLKKLSCYQLMFNCGVGDMIQLTGHLIGGVITVTQTGLPINVNKFYGGFTNGLGWMSYMMSGCALALDRYIHICQAQYNGLLFGRTSLMAWIALSWLMGLAWFVAYLSPYVNFTFVAQNYVFYYGPPAPWNGYAQVVGFWLNTGQMIFMCACYLMVIINVKRQVNKVLDAGQAAEAQKKERALMKQAALICLYTLLFEIYFDVSAYLPQNKYAWSVINVLWIFNGGINPLVYLTLNRTLRRRVLQMCGRSKNTNTTTLAGTVGHSKLSAAGSAVSPR